MAEKMSPVSCDYNNLIFINFFGVYQNKGQGAATL